MRSVVQRVKSANIKVNSRQISSIGKGIVVFVGIGSEDINEDADYMASKIISLRIFNDKSGKMDLSLKDINGQALIVSQFTLYGDCRKGKRPSFGNAAGLDKAKTLYEYLIEKCKQSGLIINTGVFRENMQVELINDGPVTILIDSKKMF